MAFVLPKPSMPRRLDTCGHGSEQVLARAQSIWLESGRNTRRIVLNSRRRLRVAGPGGVAVGSWWLTGWHGGGIVAYRVRAFRLHASIMYVYGQAVYIGPASLSCYVYPGLRAAGVAEPRTRCRVCGAASTHPERFKRKSHNRTPLPRRVHVKSYVASSHLHRRKA
jgi:hypothetical protein